MVSKMVETGLATQDVDRYLNDPHDTAARYKKTLIIKKYVYVIS